MIDHEGLTVEERAYNSETSSHIRLVARFLHHFAKELLDRADRHDESKLHKPEVDALSKAKPLAGMTYGTAEFINEKKKIQSALDHHYAKNDHHPEHFKDGVNDMNLVQLVEMLCDWKASSTRHNDGNIRKSIEINADRFGLSPQVVAILENTVDFLNEVEA